MGDKAPITLMLGGIVAITGLEFTAMALGLDGTALSLSIGAICLIVGVKIDPATIFKGH